MTHEPHSVFDLGRPFRKRIQSLIGSFDVLTQVLNRGDKEMAAVLADRILTGLSRLQVQIKKQASANGAFLAALQETRMPTYDEDVKLAADLVKKSDEGDEVPSGALLGLINRLEMHLTALDGAVAYLYPDGTWKQKIRLGLEARRKPILITMGVALALVAAAWAVRTYEGRKYALHRELFSDQALAHPYSHSLDSNLNFDWGYGPPKLGFKVDDFGVRWTGFLVAEMAGDYEFTTVSDDGVRLWVKDTLLIDDWSSHSMEKRSGTVHLEPGCHSIRLDYFENNAAAGVRLLWKTPAGKEPILVPSSAFRSDKSYCR